MIIQIHIFWIILFIIIVNSILEHLTNWWVRKLAENKTTSYLEFLLVGNVFKWILIIGILNLILK